MNKRFIFLLMFLLMSSVIVSAVLPISLSNQATDVLDSNGVLIDDGNLTVNVYDAASGGTLVFSEVYTEQIDNGTWNVMLGANASNNLSLEYGKKYYTDYLINGADINFTDYTGSEVDRQFFYAPLGDIADEDISDDTNLTLSEKITFKLGEVIDNIVDGVIGLTGNVNVTGNLTVFENVGIGTANPSELFHVNENKAGVWAARVEQDASTGHGLVVEHAGTSSDYYGFGVYDGTNFDFVVKEDGSVGIGTASPATALHVNGSEARFQSGATYFRILPSLTLDSYEAHYLATSGLPLGFRVGGANRMAILENGNVGIGTTSPSYDLDINDETVSIQLNSSGADSHSTIIFLNDAQRWNLGNEGTDSDSFVLREATVGKDVIKFQTDGDVILNPSAGNTGIGTESPEDELDVYAANDPTVRIRSTGGSDSQQLVFDSDEDTATGYIRWADGSDANVGEIHYAHATDSMGFKTNDSVRLKILGDGNVGIGTESPDKELHINGTDAVTLMLSAAGANPGNATQLIFTEGTGTSSSFILNHDGSANKLYFNENYGGTESTIMTLQSDGYVGIGESVPEELLHLKGDGDITQIFIEDESIGGIRLRAPNDATNAYLGTTSASTLGIGTGDDIEVTILSSGSVGIGTGNPSHLFEVAGDVNLNNTLYVNKTSGNVGIGTASPDSRLHVSVGSNTPLKVESAVGAGGYLAQIMFADAGHATTGDEVGRIGFIDGGVIGGDNAYGMMIQTDADSDNKNIYLVPGESIAMTIQNTTNYVGIGTESPERLLHVQDGDASVTSDVDSRFVVESTDTVETLISIVSPGDTRGGLKFESDATSGSILYYHQDDSLSNVMSFGTNGRSEDVVIDGSGDVGIGTESPFAKLDIADTLTSQFLSLNATDSAHHWSMYLSNNGLAFRDVEDSSNRVTFDYSGNVGIGTESPARLLDVSGGTLKVGTNTVADRWTTDGWNRFIEIDALTYGGGGIIWTNHSTGDGISRGLLSNHGKMYFARSTKNDNSAAPTYDMMIDETGKVGIGTIGPNRPLHVDSGSGAFSSQFENDNTNISIYADAGGAGLFVSPTNLLSNSGGFYIQPDYDVTYLVNGSLSRFTIKNGGNVGIGTSSPSHLLDVSGVSTVAQIKSTAGAATFIVNSSNNAQIRISRLDNTLSSSLAFQTAGSNDWVVGNGIGGTTTDFQIWNYAGSEAMRITSSGSNVGIGTSTPQGKLDVAGDVHLNGTGTNQLHLPLNNDATNPTIAFGDGDTGIYEVGANILGFTLGGTAKFSMSGNKLAGLTSGAPSLINEDASATNPTLLPDSADLDTGIGTAAADQLSLIAGGTEAMHILSNDVQIGSGIDFSVDGDGFNYDTSVNFVGIGATDPTHKLNVVGDANITGAVIFADGTNQTSAAGSGGHTISTINDSGLTDFTARTKLAFDDSYFNISDNSSGDFTEVSFSNAVALERQCPDGFTKIENAGITLGCMQTTQEGTSSQWQVANDDCWDTYGGRLPFAAEAHIARANYVMTDEDQREWYGDGVGIATVSSYLFYYETEGDDWSTSYGGHDSTNDYRCFIPEASDVYAPGTSEVTDIWGVVDEQSVTSASSVNFTDLQPGTTYRLQFNHKMNTADNNIFLQFNNDGGSNYEYRLHGYHSSECITQSTSDTKIPMECYALPNLDEYRFGWIEFQTADDDNTIVSVIGQMKDHLDGGDVAMSYMGAEYDGASALTSLEFVPEENTITGSYKLMKLGPAIVQTDTRMECPGGFTEIVSNGITLGCMQTGVESTSAQWDDANDACFSTYGGRLPNMGEIYIAANNYALSDETTYNEWVNDLCDGGLVNQRGYRTSGSIAGSNCGTYTGTFAHRCFIPNIGGEPYPEGVAISVPASASTTFSSAVSITSTTLAAHNSISNLTVQMNGGQAEIGFVCNANVPNGVGGKIGFLIDNQFVEGQSSTVGVLYGDSVATSGVAHDVSFTYLTNDTYTGSTEFAMAFAGNGMTINYGSAGACKFYAREVRNVAGTGDVASNGDNTFIGENIFSNILNVTGTFFASKKRINCPAGFTEVHAQGRALGCMQTAEEGSAAWLAASDNCFDTYGGELPGWDVMYTAVQNYNASLTDESNDDEWTSDRVALGIVYYDGVAPTTMDYFGIATSHVYRCWIPS
ncbi:hypothetical protein ACFLZZ_02680 [Nanoarchaeota archaeon]